MEEVFQRSF